MSNMFCDSGPGKKIKYSRPDIKAHMNAIKYNNFHFDDVDAVTDYYERRIEMLILNIGRLQKKSRDLLALPKVKAVILKELLIEKLPLSGQTLNCLNKAGIDSISKLCATTCKELRAIDGMETENKNEIIEALAVYGLTPAGIHVSRSQDNFMPEVERKAEIYSQNDEEESET